MTKQRPPLSLDAALGRISGELPGSWDEMAAVVGRSVGTVRKWGDHDQPEQIPMPAAIALDIAYQRAGGEGAPIFETYALMVQVSREEAFADQIALVHRACELIRECAEAHEALVLASLPDATAQTRDTAARQLQDVVDLLPTIFAQLLRSREAPP